MTSINRKVVERCLTDIKNALKQKGLKYAKLAELLGVSEVTVKRMLNQTDIGLDRLITLADITGLDAGDLLKKAKNSPQQLYYFSDVQDSAFFNYPHLYHYFCELFYYKKSPEQIQQENKLNDVSTYQYLRKLEDVELIELLPQNKVNFKIKPPLGFSAESLMLKKMIARHIKATCDTVLSKEKPKDVFMRIKPIRAPQSYFKQLELELTKVIDRYTEIAEAAFSHQEALPTFQVTVVGHPFDLNDPDLDPIVNTQSFE